VVRKDKEGPSKSVRFDKKDSQVPGVGNTKLKRGSRTGTGKTREEDYVEQSEFLPFLSVLRRCKPELLGEVEPGREENP